MIKLYAFEIKHLIIYTICMRTIVLISCFYSNVSIIVLSGLTQLYDDTGNLQGIPNWTLYLVYGDRLFPSTTPFLAKSCLILILHAAHLLFALFPRVSKYHCLAQWLNSHFLFHKIQKTTL